jgi:hypothetical protein
MRRTKLNEYSLILLLTIHPFVNGEIFTVIIFFIASILLAVNKLPKLSISVVIPLILILFQGIVVGLRDVVFWNVFKDIWFHGKPILLLLLAISIGKNIKLTESKFLGIIIYTGVISAIWHFIEIILVPNFLNLPLQTIRNNTRPSSWIDAIAFCILLYTIFKDKLL